MKTRQKIHKINAIEQEMARYSSQPLSMEYKSPIATETAVIVTLTRKDVLVPVPFIVELCYCSG